MKTLLFIVAIAFFSCAKFNETGNTLIDYTLHFEYEREVEATVYKVQVKKVEWETVASIQSNGTGIYNYPLLLDENNQVRVQAVTATDSSFTPIVLAK